MGNRKIIIKIKDEINVGRLLEKNIASNKCIQYDSIGYTFTHPVNMTVSARTGQILGQHRSSTCPVLACLQGITNLYMYIAAGFIMSFKRKMSKERGRSFT